MDVAELYRTIGQQHCRLGQSYLALAEHLGHAAESYENRPPESEPELSTDPTEVHAEMAVHKPSTVPPALCFDWSRVEFPPVPVGSRVRLDHGEFYTQHGIVTEDAGSYCEIMVDNGATTILGKRWLTVKSVPTEGNEVTAVVASTIPDHVHELGSCSTCDNAQHNENVARASEPIRNASGVLRANGRASESPQPTRSKTDLTASQWATSKHFLAYVKRTEPFSTWTAEEQNAKRDEFVAAQSADLVLNRWGQRFAKFCGVSSG